MAWQSGGGHGHARPLDPWSFVVDETVAMASRGRALEWQGTSPWSIWRSVVINKSRMRTMRQYNLPLLENVRTVGRFGMPMLEKQDVTAPETLIGFNYVAGAKKQSRNCGVHFFIDDYQFSRVWNQPERYVVPLGRFQCVLTPDFSTYMDMPEAMKIWNVFRSRLIGAYWQACGLKVIPTLQWAGSESFSYCFSGIPSNSTVAVSTVGCHNDPTAELYWRLGMGYAIDRLAPERILLYGDAIPFFDFGDTQVVAYRNSNVERMKKWAEEDQARAQDTEADPPTCRP